MDALPASSPRRARLLAAALLALSALWLAWGATTVLERAHDAASADLDPNRWRFWTRETLELRALLQDARASVPPGADVVVLAPRGPDGDGSEVALWAQFLAPRYDVVWYADGATARARYRLRWNLPAPADGWIVVSSRGRFVLEARGARR